MNLTEAVRQRFWRHVAQGPACWLWTGSRTPAGYGQVRIGRTTGLAHRVAYQLVYGSIPEGTLIRHRCDVPACVNPAHLLPGTHADNMSDRTTRGRHGMQLYPERRPYGARNGRAKLSWDQVQAMRAEYALGGISERALAKKYGIGKSQAHDIVAGHKWPTAE